MSEKILSVDLGTKYIGLAISDPEQKIAFPLEVVPARPQKLIFNKIYRLIRTEDIKILVLGRPTSLAGNKLPMTELVDRFGDELQKQFGLKIIYTDERLSTKMAGAPIKGGRPDARAAAIFLQNYLDLRSREKD